MKSEFKAWTQTANRYSVEDGIAVLGVADIIDPTDLKKMGITALIVYESGAYIYELNGGDSYIVELEGETIGSEFLHDCEKALFLNS